MYRVEHVSPFKFTHLDYRGSVPVYSILQKLFCPRPFWERLLEQALVALPPANYAISTNITTNPLLSNTPVSVISHLNGPNRLEVTLFQVLQSSPNPPSLFTPPVHRSAESET